MFYIHTGISVPSVHRDSVHNATHVQISSVSIPFRTTCRYC